AWVSRNAVAAPRLRAERRLSTLPVSSSASMVILLFRTARFPDSTAPGPDGSWSWWWGARRGSAEGGARQFGGPQTAGGEVLLSGERGQAGRAGGGSGRVDRGRGV